MADARRIAWLDFAKGLTMLTVIFGHAGVYNDEKFFVDALVVVYEFHMPFFFVTAGFLLNLEKWGGVENFKPFVEKLFRRLMVPYYLAELAWYPIWFLAGHVMGHAAYIRNENLSPVDALLGIFIGNGNLLALVPLWFLPALFFAEIIFVRLFNRLNEFGAEIFTLAVVALSYLGYVTGKIFFLPLSLDVALTAQIFLLTGVLIRKHNIVERLTTRRCLILLGAFVLIFFLNGKITMAHRDYGDWFLLNIGGLVGTLLMMKFSVTVTRLGGKFCDLMKYCGRQSLFVMTTHLIIAFAVYDAAAQITGLSVEAVRPLPEIIFAITLLGFLIPLWVAVRFGKLPVLKKFCA